MERIYFDNAATTPLDEEAAGEMLRYMNDSFGNPSSVHAAGREARLAVETARKTVARLLNVRPAEIIITSGGTESNNMAIAAAVKQLFCTHIITSPIEHKAVLNTVRYYSSSDNVSVSYVKLLTDGHIDLYDLGAQLAVQKGRCLVSLMHANNEIGNKTDIEAVASLCDKYKALFHTDAVQTVGHYPLNLAKKNIHFLSASGHKFHGPKGTGILYVNNQVNIKPLIHGGGQENGRRSGTENVYGIAGVAKALGKSMHNLERHSCYIWSLKEKMIKQLKEAVEGVRFNGDISEKSLYTVLNVSFPPADGPGVLVRELDRQGICVSGGSACSGGGAGSHVIEALGSNQDRQTIRVSFSRFNTTDEVDQVIKVLKQIFHKKQGRVLQH